MISTAAARLVLALLHGQLIQVLLDHRLAIDGDRMQHAQARLRAVLPAAPALRASRRG